MLCELAFLANTPRGFIVLILVLMEDALRVDVPSILG